VRGTGYIPDAAHTVATDLVRRPAGRLLGAPAAVPAAVNWQSMVDRVYDQSITNSCVGWAMSSALYLAGQASGIPIARPSPLAIYAFARLVDATPDGGALHDDGCRPTSAIDAAAAFGICAIARWPFEEWRVNDAPPMDVFAAGADAVVTGQYRIPPGDDAPATMRAALAAGHFPIFGLRIDDDFYNWATAGLYMPDMRAAERGRHMLCAIGYDVGGFRVVNSWGPTWGDAGYIWIAPQAFASSAVTDILVMTHAPAGVR
jgi:hypothetical protein